MDLLVSYQFYFHLYRTSHLIEIEMLPHKMKRCLSLVSHYAHTVDKAYVLVRKLYNLLITTNRVQIEFSCSMPTSCQQWQQQRQYEILYRSNKIIAAFIASCVTPPMDFFANLHA